MKEIEQKILGIDKKKLIAAIQKLQPKPQLVFEGLVAIKYFDFPDSRIRKKHDLLRLREIRPKGGKPFSELVYKTYICVRDNCKYLDETEFRFDEPSSFATAIKFLQKLGLKQTMYYEKKRTLYRWGNISFEIDEHPKIPAFLEIEAPSPAAIDKAIKALHLEHFEQSSESISALMCRKYPNISLSNLRF